ncbi:hypothetical protein AA313_de0208236 [Arthrobotrys entomopaga]|nr:hypothetical protein AA313_de0208236 [Arthrobotrys entomopaga]
MALILHSKRWAEPSTWYQLIAEELVSRKLATPDKAEALANNYVVKCCKRNKNFRKMIFAIGDAQDEAAKRWGTPVKRRAYIQQYDQIIDEGKQDEEEEEEDPRELLVTELFGKTQEDLYFTILDPSISSNKTKDDLHFPIPIASNKTTTPTVVKAAVKLPILPGPDGIMLPAQISPSVTETSSETLETEPGPSNAKGKEPGPAGGPPGGTGTAPGLFTEKGKGNDIPRWIMSGPGFAESSDDDDDASELNFVGKSIFKEFRF